MITSVVELCNHALGRLGEGQIQSLTADSTAAQQCNLYYTQCRDEVLEDHEWRAAKHYQVLAALATSDPDYPAKAGEDFYVFQLPVDPYCLLPISATTTEDTAITYTIVGRTLVTTAETCVLLYIRRILDPPRMNAQLAEAIVLRLASKICMRLTSNRALKNEVLQEYSAIIERARRNDASASEVEEEPSYISDLH